MGYDEYHLEEIAKELAGAERAYDSLERQMDKLIYENRDLRARLTEAELEIVRLRGSTVDEPAETPEQSAAVVAANLERMGVTLGGERS